MASTNKTANLELSQFVGTDKPDWLTDYNGDMGKIDGAYGAVNAVAEEAASNAESAATSAAQAAEDAAEALAGISGAVDAAAEAQAAAEQATSVATSALSVANGAAATAQSAAADAQQAMQIANNAKVTAENAQAAAAQSVSAAQSAAADAATAQSAATIAANDAAASAAIAATVNSRVSAIEECVPTGASASDKFALASDVSGIDTRVDAIEDCVPAGASASNKFATASDIPFIPSNTQKRSVLAHREISGATGTYISNIHALLSNMSAANKAKFLANKGYIRIHLEIPANNVTRDEYFELQAGQITSNNEAYRFTGTSYDNAAIEDVCFTNLYISCANVSNCHFIRFSYYEGAPRQSNDDAATISTNAGAETFIDAVIFEEV